jgi:hypothetical protein
MSEEYKELDEDEILSCVTASMGDTDRMQVDWEHDSWWVTCLDTGAQWSVHLCSGPESLSFEQVSDGDSE